MPTSQQDTEITLGTGRMLIIFFAFVLVCAVFFAIGFSLGKKTSMLSLNNALSPGGANAASRPSAGKDAAKFAPPAADPTFDKTPSSSGPITNSQPGDAAKESTTAPAGESAANAGSSQPSAVAGQPPNAAAAGGYIVQVAAVSHQEDADSLVDALKKKQYPAFVSNPSADKYYRVQVGPYADIKDADAIKTRLIADGYNPIVKK